MISQVFSPRPDAGLSAELKLSSAESLRLFAEGVQALARMNKAPKQVCLKRPTSSSPSAWRNIPTTCCLAFTSESLNR